MIKAKTLQKAAINIVTMIGIVATGTVVGSYVPDAMQYISDIGTGDINQSISDKYQNKIVLFGRDTCPFCKKGKELLAANNIDYVYLNIETNEEASQQFNEIKEDGVPVLIVGDQRLRGFLEEEWKKAISQGK